MNRMLLALPLVGAMMTAPLAYAQTPPASPPASASVPDSSTETQAGDAAETARDCPDPTQAGDVDDTERTALTTPDGSGAGREVTNDFDRNARGVEPNADASGAQASDAADIANRQTAEAAGVADEPHVSETEPDAGADSGTAPGGSGSSGWTGGLGGSDIGTSQSEELPSSPDEDHPETATGLDPISGETAVEGPQAPPPADDDADQTVAALPDC